MSQLIWTLAAIGTALLIFGAAYAVYIYHKPFPPGWTWASVLIGVGITEAGIVFATLATLDHLGLLQYWWFITYPVAAYAITGGAMIVGQVWKHIDQKQRNQKLNGETETILAK